MKSFIITLCDNPESLQSANKAIESAKHVGYTHEIQLFNAVTPEQWQDILPYRNLFNASPRPDNHYQRSRPDSVGACFASHYLLWKKCVELAEPILILEHDAVFKHNIPDIDFDMCVNFGRPSFVRPKKMNYVDLEEGLQPLEQPHFFGHHAYAIKPDAAEIFVNDVETRVLIPNDVWVDKKTYPWLQEYRPYPIWADTNFSTIQNEPRIKINYDGDPDADHHPYNVIPDTPEHKYIKKYYPQCLEAPQSKRFIEV